MTYGTVFSGIGGWEVGLQACGWQLKWQCERERFCQVLLNERFGVPICGDVNGLVPWLDRKFGNREAARVDAIVGSPPCQPFSVAGKKCGSADSRHLFPVFIRAVRKLRPRWVLMEQVANVLGIERGRVFGGYVGGLAEIGYDCVWHCIPACAVGANHQRDRIWVVAHDPSVGRGEAADGRESGKSEPELGCQKPTVVANAARERCGETWRDCERSEERFAGSGEVLADCSEQQRAVEGRKAFEPGWGCEIVSDSGSAGREEQHAAGFAAKPADGSRDVVADDVSNANGNQRVGWSGTVQVGRIGSAGGFEEGCDFSGDQWRVEPEVGRVADGVPFRVDRLKGLGNAVVPQIPFIIGQAINEIERMK